MIDRPLRIGFIGAGQMARHHLSTLERVAVRTAVVGVHDPAFGRADEFAAAAGTRPFRSIDALLTEARPDVVHVCTPPAAHFDAARAALDGGAHVYVEKPFALTTADARALLELAADTRIARLLGASAAPRPRVRNRDAARGRPRTRLSRSTATSRSGPSGRPRSRMMTSALAEQVVDILPHPLYTLVAVLERFGPPGSAVEIAWAQGGPSDLQAVLRAGTSSGGSRSACAPGPWPHPSPSSARAVRSRATSSDRLSSAPRIRGPKPSRRS